MDATKFSGATLATASIPEKQRVSHRGRAFEALIDALAERGDRTDDAG